MLSGREKGKTLIIGGYSPLLFCVPKAVFELGPVIGINLYGRDLPCDYWIASDTFRWHEWKEWMEAMQAVKFLRKPNRDVPIEADIPDSAADYWFDVTQEDVPTTWTGTLGYVSSTALSAISLAIVLGASDTILAGVDFVGSMRADGSSYGKSDFWAPHMAGINELLQKYQRHIKIWKTHPDSPLECPLLDLKNAKF